MRKLLPKAGQDWESLDHAMSEMAAGDTDWRRGRVPVGVAWAGEDVYQVSKKAFMKFFTESTSLGPRFYPGVKRIEEAHRFIKQSYAFEDIRVLSSSACATWPSLWVPWPSSPPRCPEPGSSWTSRRPTRLKAAKRLVGIPDLESLRPRRWHPRGLHQIARALSTRRQGPAATQPSGWAGISWGLPGQVRIDSRKKANYSYRTM